MSAGNADGTTWQTTTTLLGRLALPADRSAWEQLDLRFRPAIARYALRRGLDAATADDVVQSTLEACAQGFRDGRYDRSRGRLGSWLFGIARRQVQAALRSRARQPASLEQLGSAAPDAEAADRESWDEAWRQNVMTHCLGQVRQEVADRTYRAFVATVLEGRSPDEVAAELGTTRNAIYVAKHKILKRMRGLARAFEE